MWKKDESPNQKEEDFFDGLTNIYNICLQFVEDEYGPDLASNFTNIFYYKQTEFKDKKGKTKKKKDESAAPVLYVKLIYSDKSKKYFLFLEQKEILKLIHLIILINILTPKWQLLLNQYICLKI